MDIEKIVVDKVKELVDSKTIENAITDGIERSILAEVNSIFTGYEFRKNIERLIREQIGDIASTIKLNSYNTLITQTIEEMLNNHVKDDLVKKMKSVVEKQFMVTEKEIKLSDVVKAIKDDYEEDEEYTWSVPIETISSGSNHYTRKRISFFFNDEEDNYDNIVIDLESDWESDVMRIKGVEYKSFELDKIQTLRTYDDIECLLIKAYLNKLPFVIDMSASECEEELYKGSDC